MNETTGPGELPAARRSALSPGTPTEVIPVARRSAVSPATPPSQPVARRSALSPATPAHPPVARRSALSPETPVRPSGWAAMQASDSAVKDSLWRNVAKPQPEATQESSATPVPPPAAASPAAPTSPATADLAAALAPEVASEPGPDPDVSSEPVPEGDKEPEPAKRERSHARGSRRHPPPIPKAVKWIGAAVLIVVLVIAAWFGSTLGETPKPQWELVAPVQVGEYVAANPEKSTSPDGELELVRATYSDGTHKFVLVLSRSLTDLGSTPDVATLLRDNGVTDATEVDTSSCGVAVDNGLPVCVRVVDATTIFIAGLTQQEYPQLAELVNTMYEVLRNG